MSRDVTGDDEPLRRVRAASEAGPFRPDWASLRGYQAPQWYRDAKFGIFVHWGVYSVPGFRNEWYPRNMYREGTPEFAHHVSTHGPQDRFGYKDFIPQFTARDFDPDDWAAAFKRAGAQFVVPVAEHHDGFAMYDTARSRWKATTMGPRRDVIGELAAAVRRQWMVFGLSSHRAEHWWFMNGGRTFPSDVRDPAYADLYGPAAPIETRPNEQFLQDWLLRTVELVDSYRPQLVWFDWWIEQPAFEPYLRTFAAYYYNQAASWQRDVVINYKWDAFAPGTAVHDIERGVEDQVGDGHAPLWQNDTSVAKDAWCWVDGHDYKTLPELIGELVDVVARNGVLLLNVGPTPEGTIAPRERDLLDGIGRWLAVNGAAIYGTRPWRVVGEGPTEVTQGSFADGDRQPFTAQDLRFTTRSTAAGEYLYVIALGWPADGVLRITSLGANRGLLGRAPRAVEVLGHSGEVTWTREPGSLDVRLPDRRPSAHGVAVRLTLAPAPPAQRLDESTL